MTGPKETAVASAFATLVGDVQDGTHVDPLSIAAASGLRSRMDALDLLANNVANAPTSGFKGDRELYNLYFGRAGGQPSALPVIEGRWIDFSQGLLETTENALDIALAGEGFFEVESPTGLLYTRNGSFGLTEEGYVVTNEGYPVRLAGQQQDKRLRVDREGAIQVSPTGEVQQAGRILGQLEIVRFDAPQGLTKFGKSYFEADAAAVKLPSLARLHQGKIEASNVSLSESAVRIVEVMRQFEILQKAVTTADEMNRQTVSDIARVGQ